MLESRVSQPNRLPQGGAIDRARPLNFRFDNKPYSGCTGDTLASALLAADVRLVARSFKYHRPRGILAAGSEEPNALVELREGAHREPNTRATTVELFDGLEARSQNRWPSLRCDLGSINSLLSPLFVAGFYYKTFMWPAAWWEKVYEPAIRRAAGLGRASTKCDPDKYEKTHAFCDVLVIGSGPAGLSAALAAAHAGARVILCEEDSVLGGRLNSDRREINGDGALLWARQVESELGSMRQVRILRRTAVFGAYDGGVYGAIERVADHRLIPRRHEPRQRFWKIVAKQAVLASGAVERPIVFGGNDRPGVMLAGAVRSYLNRFAVTPGRSVAVYTTTDDGWTTATDLERAGVAVAAIIDSRHEVPRSVFTGAGRLATEVFLGASVLEAQGCRTLRSLVVRDSSGRRITLATPALAVSGGWTPNLAISTHRGGRPTWDERLQAFVPGDTRGIRVVGAARGSFALGEALREGNTVGIEAAKATGHRGGTQIASARADDEATGLGRFFCVEHTKGKAFVDFQHDVTREDILLAVQEGFGSVEHLKRYTTLGMGTDQGRTSNANGLAILASATGRLVSEMGAPVTSRPPIVPIALGALAGSHRGMHFRPTRLTASHQWAQERGATFVEVGPWMRAQWFTAPGEADWQQTVLREVRAVRDSVGVCDVSTLGKIDLQGADAGAFLDRIYINMFSTLPEGRVRYGVMLREDGFVMDDGTVAHLRKDHYILTTTTVNAAKIMQHLEHARQVLWPQLDVQIASVTDQWAQYAIAGPNARRVLERLLGDSLDVSDASLPYLACAQFNWRGMLARLFRISFSGELSYELAVPARYGDAVIRAIVSAGREWSMTPYGTEALGVMRIEKGHVAGNELNGTTTAADLGFGRMFSTSKDFIGRVLALRPALVDSKRPVLVGVKPTDPEMRLNAGAHFLAVGASGSLANDEGYITSVAFSPMLGSWIGLGLLTHGRERLGERVRAYDPLRASDVEVEVTSPTFFDSAGLRLQG